MTEVDFSITLTDEPEAEAPTLEPPEPSAPVSDIAPTPDPIEVTDGPDFSIGVEGAAPAQPVGLTPEEEAEQANTALQLRLPQFQPGGAFTPGSTAELKGVKQHSTSAALQAFNNAEYLDGDELGKAKLLAETLWESAGSPLIEDENGNMVKNYAVTPEMVMLMDPTRRASLMQTPVFAVALERRSIVARNLLENAENLAILRNELGILFAAEGAMITAQRLTEAMELGGGRALSAMEEAMGVEEGVGVGGSVGVGTGLFTAMKRGSLRNLAVVAATKAFGGLALGGGDEAAVQLFLSAADYARRSALVPNSDLARSLLEKLPEMDPLSLTEGAIRGMELIFLENPAAAVALIQEVSLEQIEPMAAAALATAVTGPAGGIALSSALTFAQEQFAWTPEALKNIQENFGHDLNTEVGIRAFVADDAARGAFLEFGLKRAGPITAAGLIAAGVVRALSRLSVSRLAKVGGATVSSAAWEFSGEAGAMIWSGAGFTLSEAVLEGLAGGHPVTVSLEAYTAGAYDFKERADAKAAREWLKSGEATAEAISGIPTEKLSAAAAVLAEKLKAEGVDTVYIPAEELQSFDQDGSATETLGLTSEAVAEAARNGQDVAIDAAAYIRHILGKEGFDALQRHTRFDVAGMTAAEAEVYESEGIGSEIQQRMQEVAEARIGVSLDDASLAKLHEDTEVIRQDVIAQLEATGVYTGEKANLFGQITAQRYATRAVRMTEETGQPVDALDLFMADNLRIQGEAREQAAAALEQRAEAVTQKIGSGRTSRKQVSATFNSKQFKEAAGDVNIDIGGGKFDLATDQLAATGTENIIFDPVNRDAEHNAAALDRIRSGQGDTVTVNNVLNVIAEPGVRSDVIALAGRAVKEGGKVFFKVFPNKADGVGRETRDGFQTNMKAAAYMTEIEAHFGTVERKGNLIIASDPLDTTTPVPVLTQLDETGEAGFLQDGPATQAERIDAAIEAKPEGMADGTKHGVLPHLRTLAQEEPPTNKASLLLKTTNANAQKQLDAIDGILDNHPDAHTSPEAWAAMMAEAYGSPDVPMSPYRFISDINGQGSIDSLMRLTPGQTEDADHGFENAAEFREAYMSGELGVDTTGKLFLWSFLSRGISPYTQEGMFIDVFEGIDPWLEAAANGTFELDAYLKWASTMAPKGSGRPGAGAKANLNSFGKDFLIKMSQDSGDGRSRLQLLHDLMSNPEATGKQIRREFVSFGEGVGIDNKVVSFTLLVAGFNDVMVLDRVQFRQLYDDGRFAGINLYDGMKKDGKTVTGTPFAKQGDGVRGILIYEAIERAVEARIDEIYTAIGREGEGSVGRYHWETWVADSEQEASHGSLGAILPDALGDNTAIHAVTAKQGEYGSYTYGARYGVDGLGTGYFLYGSASDTINIFTIDQFVEFMTELKKPANGVVPTGFKVTESGNAPWYQRDGVSTEALAALAAKIAEGPAGKEQGTVRKDGQDQALPARPAADQTSSDVGLEQDTSAGPRGSFTPAGTITDQDGNPVTLIQIFEKADATTFLHESGHFWMEQLKSDSLAVGGQFKKDFDAVTHWWGQNALRIKEEATRRAQKKGDLAAVSLLQQMTEAQVKAYVRAGDLRGDRTPGDPTGWLSIAMHEQFARGTETYFASGKAPSIGLASAFNAFKVWIGGVYRRMRGMGDISFSPDVNDVMDRMLATDEEIAAANGQYAMAALLTTAEEAGMTAKQFAAYQKQVAMTNQESKAQQLSKHMRERNRIKSEEWSNDREAMREEVTTEVANQRPYRLMHILAEGGLADGSMSQGIERIPPMDQEVLEQVLADHGMTLSDLPRVGNKAIYQRSRKEGDVSAPGATAAVFEYDDVTEMLTELLDTGPFDAAVEAELDARMKREFGSMDDTGEQDAIASIHGDHTAKLLAAELAALRTTEPAFKAAFIRQYAIEQLAGTQINDIKHHVFSAAEKRHAKAAGRALRKGDRAEAYKHQFQRLVNHRLAAEALRARSDIDKKGAFLRDLQKGKKRPKMEAGYMASIQTLLAATDFRAPIGDKKRLRIELAAMAQFMEEAQENDGAVFNMPDWLLAKDALTNVRDMTYQEFLELHEAVKTLEKQGRLAKHLRLGQEDVDRQLLLAQLQTRLAGRDLTMIAKIYANWGGQPSGGAAVAVNSLSYLASMNASLLRTEFLLESLDGAPLGPWHQSIYQPFIDAMNKKGDMTKEVTALIRGLIEDLPKSVRNGLGKKLKPGQLGGLGTPGMHMTRGSLIMLALNTGNASNLDKLIRGMGGDPKATNDTEKAGLGWNINEALLDKAFEQLTKEEWSLIQGVWDQAEKMWPEASTIYERENGVAPPRVEPRTVNTPFGPITGGYFPMMYDNRRPNNGNLSRQEQRTALEVMQSRVGVASVNSSMTQSRTDFAAPVLLDFEQLTRGFDNVIHFITHYNAVRNSKKILGDKKLRAVLENTVGKDYAVALDSWVAALAANGQDRPPVDWLDRLGGFMARNTTMAALGWSYTTMGAQALGLTSALDRLTSDQDTYGPITMSQATLDLSHGLLVAASPENYRMILSKSKMMVDRRENFDREVQKVLRHTNRRGAKWSTIKEKTLFEWGMQSLAEIQFFTVDIPTWTAAYNRALRDDAGDEARAIAYADRTVRLSQSSGNAMDLSQMHRDATGLKKLSVMFYTWFSALYGMLHEVSSEFRNNVRSKPTSAISRAATRAFVLLTLQAAGMALLKGELPDWEPEDPEEETMVEYLAWDTLRTALATLPVVRDIANGAMSDWGYSGSPLSIFGDAFSDSVRSLGYFSDEDADDISDIDRTELVKRLKPLVIIAGIPVGAPAIQINRFLDGLAAFYDDAYNWHWGDLARGYDEDRALRRDR